MSRPKGSKNKVKSLKVNDGQLLTETKKEQVNEIIEQPRPKYRNLAEIMGEDINPVNAGDFEKFRMMLASMNTADIETLCPKYGLIPVDSRAKMIERLEREFKKRNRPTFDFQSTQKSEIKDKKLEKEVLDILSLSR